METQKIDDDTISMSNFLQVHSIKKVVPKNKHICNIQCIKKENLVLSFKWQTFRVVFLRP